MEYRHIAALLLFMSLLFAGCQTEAALSDALETSEATTDGPTLPLILINTLGNTIVDEPKNNAFLEIFKADSILEAHAIGIEYRRSSSQALFDKKSYGFETRDENNEDLNVPLGGYPEEEDWILYGPYSDKTLVRNVLIYQLSNAIGRYATRTDFYELKINDDFLGTFVLMEKIKRDKHRVDIKKNKEEDISGGYILKIDKTTGDGDTYNSAISFPSQFDPNGNPSSAGKIQFLYEYPDEDDITDEQKTYIQQYIHEFETQLLSENFSDPALGYAKYIDVGSFIDFFILNEISKNPDAYRLSTFMHKDRGGLLNMGPIWDFNIAFGNVNYCDGASPEGWSYKFNDSCPNDFWLVPFWWNRLMQDSNFTEQLKTRWNTLRNEALSTNSILNRLQENIDVLEANNAVARNYNRWPILGTYIWPNSFVGESFSDEVLFLKEWIQDRLAWMDQAMEQL